MQDVPKSVAVHYLLVILLLLCYFEPFLRMPAYPIL